MKVGIIMQARMGSTRLPAKIFLPASGRSMLEIEVSRLRATGFPIFIATTNKTADEVILDFARDNNLDSFAGDEENVLKRYYECAEKYKLDVIARVTSDCPLIDAKLVKNGIEKYLEKNNPNLFLSNTLERTYPRGFDFEIFSFKLLSEAYSSANQQSDLEHVTPYIWKNRSGKVIIEQIKAGSDASRFRITLDTTEDYSLIRQLIEQYDANEMTGEQIIDLLEAHPELVAINAPVRQKDIE